jgi:hypothetical protein
MSKESVIRLPRLSREASNADLSMTENCYSGGSWDSKLSILLPGVDLGLIPAHESDEGHFRDSQ